MSLSVEIIFKRSFPSDIRLQRVWITSVIYYGCLCLLYVAWVSTKMPVKKGAKLKTERFF